MSDSVSDLELLRRRIDEIDDRLQDLLIERAEIVASVGAHKRGRGALAAHQPWREAEIIRRLVRRGKGAFPTATLVRMWRELLAATVRMQSTFTVAVYAPPQAPGYWDLARDHYGSHTPMAAYRSLGEVLRAVSEGRASVGVLPMPEEGEADSWWPHLIASGTGGPHVIARLPFAGRGNARGDGGDALVIGRGAAEASGEDRSLIAIETQAELSRARLIAALANAGLAVTLFIADEGADTASNLVEIDDFVTSGDRRLDAALAPLGDKILRVALLGAYARPFAAQRLEARAGA
jgi:chorismate mutase / prephenate dehydratase